MAEKLCPNPPCKAVNPAEAVFCQQCGTRLPVPPGTKGFPVVRVLGLVLAAGCVAVLLWVFIIPRSPQLQPSANRLATASITGPANGTVSENYSVSFSGVAQDTRGNTLQDVTYTWDFGDGSTGDTSTAVHTYKAEGAYTVKLKAADRNGLIVISAPIIITIQEKAVLMPAIHTDITGGEAPLAISVDASGSTSTKTISMYQWDWGDGTSAHAAGVSAQHTYDRPGDYQLQLTINDDKGHQASASLTIHVAAEVFPTARFSVAPASAVQNHQIQFDASSSIPASDARIIEYSWDFGDGSYGYDERPVHVFSKIGQYRVNLTIRDFKKRSATAWQIIEIRGASTPQIPPLYDAARVAAVDNVVYAVQRFYKDHHAVPVVSGDVAQNRWANLMGFLVQGRYLSDPIIDPSGEAHLDYRSDSLGRGFVVGATLTNSLDPHLATSLHGAPFGMNCGAPVYCRGELSITHSYLLVLKDSPWGLSGYVAVVTVPAGTTMVAVRPIYLKKRFHIDELINNRAGFRAELSDGPSENQRPLINVALAEIVVLGDAQPVLEDIYAQDAGPKGYDWVNDNKPIHDLPKSDFEIIPKS